MRSKRGNASAHVVLELYETLRDSRTEEMLALVDPQVICLPLVWAGLGVYEGHDGMVRLDHDMHAAHGKYQVKIDKITVWNGGSTVTVQAAILAEPGRGQPSLPVKSVYTLHDGLITFIESLPITRETTD
jgi:hypothetical protein